METCCFAIIPDDADEPTALFHDLEDAMSWGVEKYGGDSFVIRHVKNLRKPARKTLAAA